MQDNERCNIILRRQLTAELTAKSLGLIVAWFLACSGAGQLQKADV